MTVLLTMLAILTFCPERHANLQYFRENWVYHLVLALLGLPLEILMISRIFS